MNIIADLTQNIHQAFHTHPVAMIGLVFVLVIFIACAVTALDSGG